MIFLLGIIVFFFLAIWNGFIRRRCSKSSLLQIILGSVDVRGNHPLSVEPVLLDLQRWQHDLIHRLIVPKDVAIVAALVA